MGHQTMSYVEPCGIKCSGQPTQVYWSPGFWPPHHYRLMLHPLPPPAPYDIPSSIMATKQASMDMQRGFHWIKQKQYDHLGGFWAKIQLIFLYSHYHNELRHPCHRMRQSYNIFQELCTWFMLSCVLSWLGNAQFLPTSGTIVWTN